jgi:hypothetical protein
MTKRNLNLLHAVSKEEVLNSKNLHVVTRSGAGRDNIPLHDRQTGKSNQFPNPDKEEQIMREALKFFRNSNQDQPNRGRQNEDMVQEFLQLLKEKNSFGRLLDLLNNILREYKEGQRPSKVVRKLSYKNKYYDPRVDLEIHRVSIN